MGYIEENGEYKYKRTSVDAWGFVIYLIPGVILYFSFNQSLLAMLVWLVGLVAYGIFYCIDYIGFVGRDIHEIRKTLDTIANGLKDKS